MFRFIRTCIADFASLLFPSLCLGCECALRENESILCVTCRLNLPETFQHHEPYDQKLLHKFAGKVPITFLASYIYFKKGGIVQKLIHSFKYKGKKEAAKEIASWYGHQLKTETSYLNNIDLIVGVPLHSSRFHQRGYNQADWIAEGISEVFNKPVLNNVLVRQRFEDSQTHKKRLERWENVKTVFTVIDSAAVSNKNMLLVDDVLTTGATLEACAGELLKAGCKSVSILTLAVASR